MEWLVHFLFAGLYLLFALLGACMAGVLAYRFYSEFRDNKRRDLEITVRSRTEKALQELADPNNNGLSWVAKPLKPKSPDERTALQNIMTELSGTLPDEDRWRLSELYEAIGLQTDDMRFVRSGNGQWYDRARAAHRLGRMRCASATRRKSAPSPSKLHGRPCSTRSSRASSSR